MNDLQAYLLKQVEILQKATAGESQRAKIILFATQIDEMLKELLKKFFKPPRAKRETDDEMFCVFAPLSSFAARIKLAYRIGLISKDDAEALDILRDIRTTVLTKSSNSISPSLRTSITSQDS